MRALLMLSVWQLKNALLRTFRDWRRLILLVAVLVVCVGFRQNIAWSSMVAAETSPSAGRIMMTYVPMLHAGAFLLLALLASAEIDRACVSAVLEFSAPDIDYLFSSPCLRRLILAAKLPVLGVTLAAITAFLSVVFSVIWLPLASLRHENLAPEAIAAVISLALCLGIYLNLAVGIELFCLRRVGRIVRWCLIAVTTFAAIGVGVALHQHGVAGLVLVAQDPMMSALFFPCRWCADAAFAPLSGRSNLSETLWLAMIYAGTLALLFARNANFYEAGMMASEKARDNRAVAAAGGGIAFTSPRKRARIYTIPPFGHGAGAILWANLAATLKRPALVFLPCVGGALVAWLATLMPSDGQAMTLFAINAYLILIASLVGQAGYQASLRRQPLVRVLPIPAWQVVLAESAPRLLPATLAGAGECVLLLAMGYSHPLIYLPLLLVGLPLEFFCLGLLGYAIALAYPGTQDKFQTVQTTFLNIILVLVVLSIQALFVVMPAASDVPRPLLPWLLILGCLATGALVFSFTERMYQAYQPAEDVPNIRRSVRPRRLPETDEALALALVFPWLGLYGQLWLQAKHPEWKWTDLFLNLLISETGLIALPALLFGLLGRYRWVEVFSWRRTTAREMTGAALLALGSLPWVFALVFVQNHFWPADPARGEASLGQFVPALAAHPILAPLTIGLTAGVAEETLYRGPILAGLRHRLTTWPAMWATGLIFAAVHMDAHGLFYRTLIGVILGWIVIRGGSIFPAMLMHAILDTAVFGNDAWLIHLHGVAGFTALVPLVWGIGLAVGTALFASGYTLCRSAWSKQTVNTAVKFQSDVV
jgi:membrane protease YdiL (CAAX protease family)